MQYRCAICRRTQNTHTHQENSPHMVRVLGQGDLADWAWLIIPPSSSSCSVCPLAFAVRKMGLRFPNIEQANNLPSPRRSSHVVSVCTLSNSNATDFNHYNYYANIVTCKRKVSRQQCGWGKRRSSRVKNCDRISFPKRRTGVRFVWCC